MHAGQQGLTKLNLATMAYDEVVDLKPFSCVPLAVNFSPLGGTVFVQCANARAESLHFQLVMDLITSQVKIVFCLLYLSLIGVIATLSYAAPPL